MGLLGGGERREERDGKFILQSFEDGYGKLSASKYFHIRSLKHSQDTSLNYQISFSPKASGSVYATYLH